MRKVDKQPDKAVATAAASTTGDATESAETDSVLTAAARLCATEELSAREVEVVTVFLWEELRHIARANRVFSLDTIARFLVLLEQENPEVHAALGTVKRMNMLMRKVPPPPELLVLLHEKTPVDG